LCEVKPSVDRVRLDGASRRAQRSTGLWFKSMGKEMGKVARSGIGGVAFLGCNLLI
jgi:hypothetical protein